MRILYQGSSWYTFSGLVAYRLLSPVLSLIFKLGKSERSRVVIHSKDTGEIILVKNWLGSGKYQLPGGGKNTDESIEQCGSREIQEELGINIRADNISLIKRVESTTYSYTKAFLICEVSSSLLDQKMLQIAHHEITEVITIKLKQVDQVSKKLDSETFNLLKELSLKA
jgi:8-oxo-dGTP pyrophosphatase MutT (NUDIX family)